MTIRCELTAVFWSDMIGTGWGKRIEESLEEEEQE